MVGQNHYTRLIGFCLDFFREVWWMNCDFIWLSLCFVQFDWKLFGIWFSWSFFIPLYLLGRPGVRFALAALIRLKYVLNTARLTNSIRRSYVQTECDGLPFFNMYIFNKNIFKTNIYNRHFLTLKFFVLKNISVKNAIKKCVKNNRVKKMSLKNWC